MRPITAGRALPQGAAYAFTRRSTPAFAHFQADLPLIEDDGVRVRLVAGSAWGRSLPVKVFSDTHYADVSLAAGGKLPVDAAHGGVYSVPGEGEDRSISVVAQAR